MNIVRNKEPQMTTEFKSWDELSDLEQAQATYWDMYKDAYNFRPRHIDTSTWTLADFEREFAELGEIMKANEITQGIEEAKAVEKFERRVAEMITIGAKDYDMAMRWMHEAEGTQGDNDFLAWSLGLPYQYFRKAA
jgi:hypothetical protein